MSATVSGNYSKPQGQIRRNAIGRASRTSSHAGKSSKSQMGDMIEGDMIRIDYFKATVCSLLSVSAEAFQHLLDKRESRQAISTFFDNPSCRLIVFHLEEAPDDGDVAG
jgi:hypothetical protein